MDIIPASLRISLNIWLDQIFGEKDYYLFEEYESYVSQDENDINELFLGKDLVEENYYE